METIFQEQPHHYELLFTARLYEFLYILCRDHCTTTASTVTADSDRDRLRITLCHAMDPGTLSGKSDTGTAASLLRQSQGNTFAGFLKNTLVRPSWNI